MNTKQCRKCGETKAVDQFGIHRDNSDGLDRWCKDCRKVDNQKWRKMEHKPAASTAEGAAILGANGIPVITGGSAGYPYEDLVAYGTVVIEVKSARPTVTGSYNFGFTKAQVAKERQGFILLITNDTKKRYFVVPANHPMFNLRGQRFVVKIGSTHPNAKWGRELEKYENAFHLIGAEVVKNINPVIGQDNYTYQKHTVSIAIPKRRTTVLQPGQPALF